MRWQNQEGGYAPQPLADFLARLPAADALLLLARLAPAAPLVVVPTQLRKQVFAHLAAERCEQGGLLLGDAFFHDGGIALVRLARAVAAERYAASGYALRMETAVWDAARRALRPGEAVVGWYHSHPDLGAFFSDTDRGTQRAFFPHAYSLGWVVDPVRGEEAWFLGAEALAVAGERIVTAAQPGERGEDGHG